MASFKKKLKKIFKNKLVKKKEEKKKRREERKKKGIIKIPSIGVVDRYGKKAVKKAVKRGAKSIKNTIKKKVQGTLTNKQYLEYKQLKQQFKITKKEYTETITKLTKAEKKIKRLHKQYGDNLSIEIPKIYKASLSNVRDRNYFEKLIKGAEEILERNYRKNKENAMRNAIKNNLYAVFGNSKSVQEINTLMDNTALSTINAFFDENPELDSLLWYKANSGENLKLKEMLSITDSTDETILARFKRFLEE